MAKITADDQGQLTCPKCGSQMVPMSNGKGFRCGVPGNRWDGNRRCWSKCNEVLWNNPQQSVFQKRAQVERPLTFPKIATPTDEQTQIKNYLRLSPTARGGSRCAVVNAGPGTGKTTTLSWSAEALYERLGSLDNYAMLAFNVNAAAILKSKLPVQVPDVHTMNGWGWAAQGRIKIETSKVRNIFKGFTEDIPYDSRPNMGCMGALLERMRDLCLYAPDSGGNWQQMIDATVDRFAMSKKFTANEKTIREYLPLLAVNAQLIRNVIDLNEQVTRPVLDAIARTNWTMPLNLVERRAEWSDEDVRHFCTLIKAIRVNQSKGLIVDEAQDLSLSQIALFLASVWKTGELTIIGDDKRGEPGEENYKAGQGIYGWRGAFPGSLTLIVRLWKELTGEDAKQFDLSVTHRCGPEIVDAVRPLNATLKSSRAKGTSAAWSVSMEQAFNAWLNLPEEKKDTRILWITRTNKPLAELFIATIKAHKACTLRGGGDAEKHLDNTLYPVAGWRNDDNQYKVSLKIAMDKLQAKIDEEREPGQPEDPASWDSLILAVGKEVLENPEILAKAEILDRKPTVGNLRSFILYFCDKESPRILTTIYRCKGDEADCAIVSDTDRFNEAWNGDPDEAAACRHVAATRGKNLLLVCGSLAGVNAPPAPETLDLDGKPVTEEPVVEPLPVKKARKPRSKK